MKVTRWLLPAVSLLLVLLLTWWDLRGARTGPGPLHPAHAQLAELAQGSNCGGCHRAGAGVDAAACNRCHTAIGSQLASASGLHGGLPAEQVQRCERCHSEHHGDAAPLITAHAFPRAGVADREAYDHRHVAYRLTGAHAQLPCVRCHRQADALEPPAGGRFLGLQQACTSCHEDSHRGNFGGDCASCHGQERPWREAPGFPHDLFPLADAHGKVECKACHAPGTAHDVAALRAAPRPPRACAACHADPHGADAGATALRLADTAHCARCHTAVSWQAARPSAEQHAAFGFPLRGDHATAACAACHGAGPQAKRWRDAAPAVAECARCHDHPHGTAVLAVATAARGPAAGCAGCHTDADPDFRTGRIDATQHAATGFPLTPPHAELACAKCHQGDGFAARFPGRAAEDCRACHRDVHGGQFQDEARYRQCTACHLPASFRPPQFGPAAHAATAFPLAGAHDAVGCTACHREVRDGVRQFHGTPRACAACHADVHGGAFDRAGRPGSVDGRSGCARCHDTAAFAPVVGTFDHALWTGYELTGAHARVDCAGCHPRAQGRSGGTTRLGRAAGSRCADCHADVHAGQFAQDGTTDCRRCHTTGSFAQVRFDHQTTRFPLDAVHRAVACAKCHLAYETPQGKVVRYRPLGTACGDCHRLGRTPGGGK